MSTTEIFVPDIGDAENVEVIEVCVQSGDQIEAEDPIVVLESDKATIEVPSIHAGKIAELKVSVGDKVSQGDLLLLMSSDTPVQTLPDSSVAVASKESSVASANKEPSAGQQPSVDKSPSAKTSSAKKVEQTLTVPDIGDVEEAEVIEISVAVGDTIEFDQPLLTLESDKASMEIPATQAGVVKSILIKEGDKLSHGSPIVLIEASEPEQAEPAVSAAPLAEKVEAQENTQAAAPALAPKAVDTAKALPAVGMNTVTAKDVLAGPAVRRLANKMGVDLGQVTGSGRKNRIIKQDVHAYVKQALAKNAAGSGVAIADLPVVDFSKYGPVESQELSKIQRMSAKNLHRSWMTIPHVTQQDEADITELEAFRKEQSASYKEQGIKLTPLAFLVKASASALMSFPKFRSSLDPTGETLVLKNYCHIGIAVDTPNGLVVPVIRDANKKSIVEIAQEMQVLSEKARNKKLSPADMSGGCFSISSLGGIGGTSFTPIVNWPEVAILGVSRSEMKPVYKDGEFVPRLKLPLSLSYDHRVIDGADAARFTTHLSALLSDIRKLLL